MTEGGLAEEVPPEAPSATILLTYRHFISGTMPLTPAARAIFPRGSGTATAVTLIDGRWGRRFSVWVVHRGRYVAGLSDWFKQHKLATGALISIDRNDNPTEVLLDFKPQRACREWI